MITLAFDLVGNGSYGSGALGDVTDPDKSFVNAYAAVDEINTYDLLVIPYYSSDYVTWGNCVGCQVMLHAVACKSGATGHSLCGRYLIAAITAAEREGEDYLRVTIDKSTADFQAGKNYYYWQAILIPEFKNLTLQSQSVKPRGFDFYDATLSDGTAVSPPFGGVLVLKCSDTLNLKGGHIDLRGFGFDYDISTAYRPNAAHESGGSLDTDLYSGSENSIAQNKLLLNAGDGACLIMAKNINCSSGSSRIGNPSTNGVQYCRGASDSANLPSGVTNLGGSTIAIVTHQFTNFTPNLIAKYHSGETGRGLARAYLAVLNAHNSPKPDEGLYALDTISRTERLKSMCNISGFGNGSDGSYTLTSTNPNKCWNSYAKVTAISGRAYTISRVNADVEESFTFEVGRLVMIHQSLKASADDWEDGRFFMSRIVAISGSVVTIKHNFSFNLSKYSVQMIIVPEFQNLTLSKVYKNTPQYYGGAGGIFAIAVNGTCNLSGGTINMEGKGTFSNVVNKIHGNYQMKGALPLGQGNGSVFILARNLTLNTSTRIGGTQDGSTFGGTAIKSFSSSSSYSRSAQGGWKGKDGTIAATNTKNPTYYGTGGSGRAGGTSPSDADCFGGWHSNGGNADEDYTTALQGAHVFIVADTITGLCLHALSTGGKGGGNVGSYANPERAFGYDGGCGYGGGGMSRTTAGNGAWGFGGVGGFHGGGAAVYGVNDNPYQGGGAGGSCFVYCNNVVNQNTTNLVLS